MKSRFPGMDRFTALGTHRRTDVLRSPGHMNRRAFLADVGMGFTGLVLGKMLADDGIVRANDARVWLPPDGQPQISPKAKSVIWIFLVGGMSQMETFDPKPELDKWAGKTIAESPYKEFLRIPLP